MLAFLLILLPLLVLAWQAWQSLNALSDQAALVNRTTLIDARRSEAMTNAALEMERSSRVEWVDMDAHITSMTTIPISRSGCPDSMAGIMVS